MGTVGALGRKEVAAMVHAARLAMEEKRDTLIELDAAMGDGDLGLTMVKGFTAMDESAGGADPTDLGKLLMQAGMAMAKAAPSTMGTLLATGFMRGGKAVAGKDTIGPADIAAFLRAFANGIRERGKTEVGNKTVLDVMHPAAEAAENAADTEDATPVSVLQAAVEGGTAGWEAAKGMQAQHGRQAYYREQSVGKADPGATAGLFMLEAMLRGVKS